ncbi:MAG: FAD-dependent oxidoreductase [Anaerolineales bacterium]|nr:FAD-dependent oxidoreductase [Anaerolineales bacterium]MCA9931066.1 FAD-dependent oxidoreductase [Anaerolineales bacterium]
MKKDVIIIGGGVAGLTAAIHLVERGIRPFLLEAHPTHIGGRLKDETAVQFDHEGKTWTFPGEHGVHGIWSPYVNLKAMLARHHILPDFVPAQDETWILGQGRRVRKAQIGRAIRRSWVPAPFHYLGLFSRPSFWRMINVRDIAAMFRLMGGLFSAMAIDPLAEQKALAGMSLADFTAGWSPTLQSMFAGLARNALAAHPEDVPVAGFIAFLRFYTLMRRDAWAFDYLPGPGGTCLSQPLAAVAAKLGVEIQLGSRALELVQDDGWQVVVKTAVSTQTVSATDLILAIDAPAARQLLQNSRPTAAAQAMYFPTGIPTAIIRIWFDRQPQNVSESGIFTGDFIVDNFFWLERLQSAFSIWHQETGGSAVEMHIYGPPELLAQSDAALLAQAAQDVQRAFPELRGHRLQTAIQRNDATHTLFSVGEPGHHLATETPWPHLFACGDWVYHSSSALYLERAATTGIAAANALLNGRSLEPWPLLTPLPPEPLAGWIARRWWRFRQRMLQRKEK